MAQPNGINLGILGDMQEVSAFGRTFSMDYDSGLFVEERAASSKLRRDWRPQKRVFTLNYELADFSVVERFEYLYNLYSTLTLEIETTLGFDEYEVLMSPFSKERFLVTGDGLWASVSVELKEV